jgi:purine catabolism regulator
VSGVNIVEVPDVWRWLRGGELLFTAGYAWRDDPAQLRDAISELHRLQVSGLAIKFGPYLEKLPEAVLQLAESFDFPIIRLPQSVAYMDVIDLLNEQLSSRRLRMFERFYETEQTFLAPGLDEQSIERLVGLAAATIESPVYVVDLIDDRVVVGDPRDGRARTGAMDLLDSDIATAIGLNDADRRALAGRAAAHFQFDDGRFALCAWLVVSREVRGAVVAVQDGREFGDFAELTLSHAADLISFLLLKRLARLQGRGEAASLLIQSLLRDRLTQEEATERALALNLRLARACAVLIIGPFGPGAIAEPDALRRGVSRVLGVIPHAVSMDEDRLVVLLQVDEGRHRIDLERSAEGLLKVAADQSLAGVVAVGSDRRGIEGLRRSWAEATLAYQAQSRIGVGTVVHFADLGVERLLSQIPHTEITERYVEALIGRVAEDPVLLRTLQVYVESGGRKLTTAARLHLHRSSLEYRLGKLSRLLDLDLSSPERLVELWLALRLRQMRHLPDVGPSRGYSGGLLTVLSGQPSDEMTFGVRG